MSQDEAHQAVEAFSRKEKQYITGNEDGVQIGMLMLSVLFWCLAVGGCVLAFDGRASDASGMLFVIAALLCHLIHAVVRTRATLRALAAQFVRRDQA